MEDNNVEVVFRVGQGKEKTFQDRLLTLVVQGCTFVRSVTYRDSGKTITGVVIIFKKLSP